MSTPHPCIIRRAANRASWLAAIVPGPILPVAPDRRALLDWLQWADHNGVWSDADNIAEGWEPLDIDDALYHMAQLLEIDA